MLCKNDGEIKRANDQFRFILAKPAKRRGSFCQVSFYRPRYRRGQRFQLLECLISMQAYSPIRSAIPSLECNICDIQGCKCNDGVKVLGAEALYLDYAHALVSVY